jgi:hypothetical protein
MMTTTLWRVTYTIPGTYPREYHAYVAAGSRKEVFVAFKKVIPQSKLETTEEWNRVIVGVS